jgi:hypothetical protein
MTEWTPQLITAIADLNARLTMIEADVVAEAKAINARLRSRLADPHDWLSDYELELHVSCWLREDDPLFKEDYDNVLAMHSTSLKFDEADPRRMQRVWYDNGENYNGCQHVDGHPLSHQHHCRLLYEISNQLGWEDLARVGTIWVDLQIYHQHRYDPELTASSSAHRVVSGSRKLLAEIARRNRRSQELREYGVPEVGIFYVVDGQVLPMTEPWPLASEWDGYRALKSTHRQLWKTISQIRGYGPEVSPTTYPRGRVSYWELSKRFEIRLDRHLHHPEIIRDIVQEFHLPADRVGVRVDQHYDCAQCQAERESEEER